MAPLLEEHLTAAIRATRHHQLSYFYYALLRHKEHETFRVEGWPRRRELGFTCECSGELREWRVNLTTLREALPEAREAFMRFRETKMRHGNKAQKRAQRQADRKAKDLLFRFLTRQQKWDLRGAEAFRVVGADGRTYEVGQLTYLLEDGNRRYSFCLVPKETLPKYDLMLAHKVLLEGDPERFLRTACVRDLKSKNVFNNGDFIVEHSVPRNNEVCDDAMDLVSLPNEVLDHPEPWIRQQIRQWWTEEHES